MINWDFEDNNIYNEKSCDKKTIQKKDDCCCCAESFRKALLLLKDPKIVEFIEFDTFGLVGKKFTAGGLLEDKTEIGSNFIPAFSSLTLQCVDCNLIKTSAITRVYNSIAVPFNNSTAVTVGPLNYWSLCDVEVCLLRVDETSIADNATSNPNAKIRNFNDFKAYFRTLLDKNNPQCDRHKDCNDCNDCCCSEDIFNQLDLCIFGNQGSIVNLTAGAWIGQGLEVLGRVGCILLLTDNDSGDIDHPCIFFVCLDSVGGIYNA